MLARTFKSYRQLKIKKGEYDALIETMHLLERGEITYVKGANKVVVDDGENYPVDTQIRMFNMAIAGQRHKKCGTVGCIGGWVAARMGAKTTDELVGYVGGGYSVSLEMLFFPDHDGGEYTIRYDPITPRQAAQAINNFLTTGHPRWDTIEGVKYYE